jgi:hypothetical protein
MIFIKHTHNHTIQPHPRVSQMLIRRRIVSLRHPQATHDGASLVTPDEDADAAADAAAADDDEVSMLTFSMWIWLLSVTDSCMGYNDSVDYCSSTGVGLMVVVV